MSCTRLDLDVSIALVALGLADPDEVDAVERACARDPAIARLRGELADVAAALPLALPRARPPPFAG